ncbi:glycosyltransferase family 4 protein [Thiotrichales bacterium 19S3-7]|nr:glycosyltransferase family 4 protein [Thiotrichales bacterium 19S3-7]MCF6800681.1 glycosyltransferase family 4 protein [Thiotrichales bacterium 19S3-11]
MARVLFVVSDDKYFLSHRLSLALALQCKGHQIYLATSLGSIGAKREIEKYGIEVHDLGIRSKGIDSKSDIKLVIKIRQFINQVKPEYVFAVAFRMVFVSLIAFKFSKANFFIGMIAGLGYLSLSKKKSVNVIKYIIIKLLKILSLSRKVSLICQNQDDFNYLSSSVISEKRLLLVQGSGVDINHYYASKEPATDHVVVTCVARMLKDKGIVELFEAAELLKKQGHDHIVIQLVGDVHNANPNTLTQETLISWHKQGIIHWLGHRDDIAQLYQNSHIAVLPSYREGLPKSLLEAAASQRAIIATDVPGCREICRNGVNGILVPVRDAHTLAGAILKLANDHQLRKQFAVAGRTMVEKEFSDQIVNAAIVKLLA